VLLTKPVPRWTLLAGKCAGVLTFVGLQALFFVGGTWLALAARTGVWDPTYLLCVPLLVLHFAVFFSFSALLAVLTRSTVIGAFGSVLFWLACCGLNFGRDAAVVGTAGGLSPAWARLLEVGYWALPKPLDLHLMLLDTLEAQNPFAAVIDTNALAARGAWLPELSVLSSLLAAALLTAVAGCRFVTADY
jgi:ABC-type transport system involved in multi-copper enzyme maturation permease subunit